MLEVPALQIADQQRHRALSCALGQPGHARDARRPDAHNEPPRAVRTQEALDPIPRADSELHAAPEANCDTLSPGNC